MGLMWLRRGLMWAMGQAQSARVDPEAAGDLGGWAREALQTSDWPNEVETAASGPSFLGDIPFESSVSAVAFSPIAPAMQPRVALERASTPVCSLGRRDALLAGMAALVRKHTPRRRFP